jgi:hypothetical protein
MRPLALGLVLLLFASVAGAAEIRSYTVRIQVHDDGSGSVSAVVKIESAMPGAIAIPIGFAKVTDLRLTQGPAGMDIVVTAANGQTLVQAVLPGGVPPALTLAFGFSVQDVFLPVTPGPGERSTLPEGSRVFRHALLNSQQAPIRSYTAEVMFPDGLRAHAIREALPKLRKSEVGPRVQLDDINATPGARLQVDRLAQGDSASMQIELVPQSRSVAWLIAGLVLSLAYLVYFKDLVARRAT